MENCSHSNCCNFAKKSREISFSRLYGRSRVNTSEIVLTRHTIEKCYYIKEKKCPGGKVESFKRRRKSPETMDRDWGNLEWNRSKVRDDINDEVEIKRERRHPSVNFLYREGQSLRIEAIIPNSSRLVRYGRSACHFATSFEYRTISPFLTSNHRALAIFRVPPLSLSLSLSRLFRAKANIAKNYDRPPSPSILPNLQALNRPKDQRNKTSGDLELPPFGGPTPPPLRAPRR